MLNQNMMSEATRLTRTGQLVEATALLQRMLRGESDPVPSGSTARAAPASLEPPTIDMKANVVADKVSLPITRLSSIPLQREGAPAFKGLKGFAGLNLRGQMNRAPPATTDIAPEGTRFITGTFRSADGSRNYKLFVPSHLQEKPLPLVVMLHGCTQSPDDFAAGTRMNFLAEEQNCFVVYPEQPSGANQSKCWNWFRTGDQQRDGGEPSLIAVITRQGMLDYPIDPKRAYVAGLWPAGRPPPSWQRPMPICTRPSGFIPASPAGRQAIFPPRSSPCGREAGLNLRMVDRQYRPSFSMATATPRCIRTTATGLSSSPPRRQV